VFGQFGGVRVCDMTRAGAEPTQFLSHHDRSMWPFYLAIHLQGILKRHVDAVVGWRL
jgi:hypothetical protein